MNEFLHRTFLGNSFEAYAWFLGWILVGLLFQGLISKYLIKILVRIFHRYTQNIPKEKFIELLIQPLKMVCFWIFIFLAFNHLEWPKSWDLGPATDFGIIQFTQKSFAVLFGLSITNFIVKIGDCINLILLEKAKKTVSKSDDQLIPFVAEIFKICIWIFGILIILSNVFNMEMGSVIAGLGIGGLAIALAAQDLLANLLGSFTIFFDKPFVVGDLITVNGITGEIEKVGFRSTRIRTLEKSYVTLPNKTMIEAELDNLSLRTFRRVDFNIGLTYNTPVAIIKKIVTAIQLYIDENENTNMEGKVKFMEFGDSALNIMVLYYINSMDWGKFLDIKEEINYIIMEIIENSGSSFAFPSTSVYIEKQK